MELKDLFKKKLYKGSLILYPKRSVNLIFEYLEEKEQVSLVTSCFFKSKFGALILTDERIIMAYKNFFSSEIIELYLSQIVSIEYTKKLKRKLHIITFFGEHIIKAIPEEAGQYLVMKIKEFRNLETKDTEISGVEEPINDDLKHTEDDDDYKAKFGDFNEMFPFNIHRKGIADAWLEE
ncbi:PH domain-containing protein [Aquimarina sp. 2201CG5-10]|uniref:PH domain-containing protein n=1 Tax=Aquimarina callyspongiae TaxID=3098150 RepID=UPI002AB49505|nr:PH domain-containing protein [Aquimarina sp. 2201CG5-10]MDY8138119.1 PH domain-containing protein [Aquimarina sp. 2201CG5-10]